jgi:beta-lactamase regulating signal transducer with metallopeptidase domain
MSGTWPGFAGWLLHSVLGGGFLLLIALPLMAACRQPARRQRLGEAALFAALVLCLLDLAPPWITLPLLRAEPSQRSSESYYPSSRLLAAGQPNEGTVLPEQEVSESELMARSHDEEFTELVDPSASVATSASEWMSSELVPTDGNAAPEIRRLGWDVAEWASALASALESFPLARWLTLAALAYAGAGVFLLGRWLLGHLVLWRLLRIAQPAPSAVNRLFETMVGGPGRRPRLLLSWRLRVPLSFGLIRPCVVLPAGLAEPNAAGALRWVFAHELTHLKRGDPWTCLLFGVGQVFYFCLPWFWWLRRQVRLCQEYIADAAAAEQAADAEDYAQFLVSLTQAPAAPFGALSVSGNSSDLFRRVTMLLQSPFRVEKCCPHWWSLATGCGLLGLAILVSGVSLRASIAAAPAQWQTVTAVAVNPADTPSLDENNADPTEKKQPKKKPALEKVLRDLEELLKDLPSVVDAEQVKRLEEQLKQLKPEVLKEQLLEGQPLNLLRNKLAEGDLPILGEAIGNNFLWHNRNEGRLGIEVQKPSAVLAEQLDLPEGEGLVIQHVLPQSAAAKGGLKANDVLLEFNGKPVPNDVAKFVRMLREVKADTPVDAMVLRKGKRRTIKGLSLPEAKANQPFQWRVPPGAQLVPAQPGGQPPLNLLQPGFNFVQPNFQFHGFGGPGNRAVMTTMVRTKDNFTTRYQEGSLIITVTGSVSDGKSKVKQIQIQDGGKSDTYDGLERVPEQYRDKVKNLIEMSEKNNIKIEVGTELRGRGEEDRSNRIRQ